MKTICFVSLFQSHSEILLSSSEEETVSIIAGFHFVLVHISEILTHNGDTSTHNNTLTNPNLQIQSLPVKPPQCV